MHEMTKKYKHETLYYLDGDIPSGLQLQDYQSMFDDERELDLLLKRTQNIYAVSGADDTIHLSSRAASERIFYSADFSQKRHLLLRPFMLGTMETGPDHMVSRSRIEFYMILHVREGAGKLEYDGVTLPLNVGDALFIDCRKKHRYWSVSDGGWAYDFIYFNGASVEGFYTYVVESRRYVIRIKDGTGFHEAFSRLEEESVRPDSIQNSAAGREVFYCPLPAEAVYEMNRELTDLLTAFMRSISFSDRGEQPLWVDTAMNYINAHYKESISLDEIADMVSISKYHFLRVFKRLNGLTLTEYIHYQRIVEAKRLLALTGKAVWEIAEELGYNSEQYFFRVFKSQTGYTPLQYRRNKTQLHR